MLSKLCVKGLRIHLYSSLYLGLNCLCLELATEGILKTRCSQKFRKIHKKTPVSESLFNNVAGLWPVTLLKKGSDIGVF